MIVGADGDGIRNRYVDLAGPDVSSAVSVAPPPGREVEIAQLAARLETVDAGEGGVALLTGEGGAGKTTLSAWVAEEARARGMVVLEAPCFELSVESPYACLIPAFGPVLRGERDLDPAPLVQGLHSLDLLFDGIDTGGDGVRPIGDELARSRLHGALATLVSRMTSHGPVVLAVDDLHWADPVSLEVLHAIVGDLPHLPLLLVATLRPFEAAERPETRGMVRALRRAEWTTTVDVEGLDVEGTRLLVQRRLGSVFPTRVVDLVHRRSGGTPLVAEELLEVMIETGALRSVGRRWVLEATADVPVPAVAVDLIGDRLERLGSAAIDLVATIAVAGRPVGVEVLAATVGRDSSVLDRELEELRRAGVVDRADSSNGTEWVVHHPIIGETAIGLLADGRLPAIHAALVDQHGFGSVERRAHHLVGAGRDSLTDERVPDLVEAGRSALERGAPEEACRVLGFALDAIDDALVGDDHLLDVLWSLGVAWTRRGELRVAGQHLDRARRLAEASGCLESEAGILVDLQQSVWDPRLRDVGFHRHADTLLPRLEAAESWRAAHRLIRTQINSRLRAGDQSRLPEAIAALEAVGRHLDDEGIDLWTRYVRLLVPRAAFEDGRGQLEELEAMLPSVAESPELHRRVLHERLDLLLLLGDNREIRRGIADERALAERFGEVPTWRVGLAMWDVALGEGDLDHTAEIEELARLVGIDRPLGYMGVADAVTGLLTAGAPGPLRREDVPRPHPDVILEQVLLHADQWRDPRDPGTARRVLEHWSERRFVAGTPLVGPVSAALGHLALGDRAGFDSVIGLLERFDGGTGRTTAWARVLVGEASTGKARADAYREAASCFERLGRPFDAAVCNVTAAENGGDVDDAALVAAQMLFDAAPAPWMGARAAAVVGSGVTEVAPRPRPVDALGLTSREREVAEVVAEGLSNREVANRLFISVRTVTSHLDHIYTKLAISSRRELAEIVRAQESGADT